MNRAAHSHPFTPHSIHLSTSVCVSVCVSGVVHVPTVKPTPASPKCQRLFVGAEEQTLLLWFSPSAAASRRLIGADVFLSLLRLRTSIPASELGRAFVHHPR